MREKITQSLLAINPTRPKAFIDALEWFKKEVTRGIGNL